MRILVTGFEPNDDGSNASKILVESLREESPESICNIIDLVSFEVLPPSSAKLKSAVHHAIEQHQAAFCVFTGQAPGRNKITSTYGLS
jgi:pyroglutamyl-peptidase